MAAGSYTGKHRPLSAACRWGAREPLCVEATPGVRMGTVPTAGCESRGGPEEARSGLIPTGHPVHVALALGPTGLGCPLSQDPSRFGLLPSSLAITE